MLLVEGSRDKALEVYIPLFQKRGININLSQLKQLLLRKFVSEAGFHNLSLDSNYYLSGVARYYFNGDLTSNKRLNVLYPNVKDKFDDETCKRLNELILILRNAYIDSVGTQFEQPEDFGTMTIQKLLRKYNKKINAALGIEEPKKEVEPKKKEVSDDYTAGNGYTYDILYSYDDARKYYDATRPGAWCITYGEQHYNAYTKRMNAHFIVFRKDGYENVKRQIGQGFTKKKPHDEYGNSLIAFLQKNNSPEAVYITSRWNHGSVEDNTHGIEADHAYTTQEFLDVVGCDKSVLKRAYEQWLETSKYIKQTNKESDERKAERIQKLSALRKFKYVQMLLNNGADPKALHENPEIKLGLYPLSSISTYEKAASDKKFMGTYYASIVCDDTLYYTLWDRKKLFFDSILVKEDKFSRFNNVVSDGIVELCVFGNRDVMFLFDTKRHKLVEVDGKIKFKDESHGVGHVCVAVSSTQYALINTSTMKPVRAKNGSPWFEYMDSPYRGIHVPYFRTSKPWMLLMYDSSADESYLYNMLTCSFVDPGPQYYYSEYQWSTCDCMRFVNKDSGRSMYVDPRTNKPLEIFGCKEFKNAICNTKIGLVAVVMPDDMDVWKIFDMQRNKFLEANGEAVRIEGFYGFYYEKENYYVGIRLSHNNLFYIFNPLTRELMHDSISGYLFKLGSNSPRSFDRGSLRALVPNGYDGPVDYEIGKQYRSYGQRPPHMVVFNTYVQSEPLAYITKSPEEDADEVNQARQVEEMIRLKQEKVMRIDESRLHDIVNEAIKNVIREKEESGIHIDPKNKGKFTATKKRTGKSTEELTHSKNPLTRKRAIFAQNAKKWNKKK